MKYPVNSVTEFSRLKIKISIFHILLFLIGMGISVFLFTEAIIHLSWVNKGRIEYSVAISAFFYTILAIAFLGILGMTAGITVNVIFIIRYARKIGYYKEDVFQFTEEISPPYDYKLWQTALKNSFHAMVIPLDINGEKKDFKSDIIFTNSKKIGMLHVPPVLQSHSYVKNRCLVGYDSNRNQAVILEVKEEA